MSIISSVRYRTGSIIYVFRISTSLSSLSKSEMNEDILSKTIVESTNLEHNIVSEGAASVFYPNNIFYNPVQEFNRDLTIAVINAFSLTAGKFSKVQAKEKCAESVDVKNCKNHNDVLKGKRDGLKILEGLAATGLRSIRFALEIANIEQVIANDFDKNAVDVIDKNIARNSVANTVTATYSDAALLMYQNRGIGDRFDVIDLDPYGSPAQFLDGAVQAVSEGGLLCVTCTDTAVLCGNASETCFSKYGSVSLRAKFCHEMALRILLRSIESHANRYSRYVKPLLSVSVDFYVRVFVRVFTGQGKVKRSLSKTSLVFHCNGCGSYDLRPLGIITETTDNNYKYGLPSVPKVGGKCRNCASSIHMGGPIWTDTIHEPEFVKSVLDYVADKSDKFKTSSRIKGMLNLVMEELVDVPLYYVTKDLCNVVHCVMPTFVQIRSAILNAGYRVSLSHAMPGSLKTDAPSSLLWDIIRCWVKLHPIKEARLAEGSPTKNILDIQPSHQADFTQHPAANPQSRENGLLRYQPNPEPEWGPRPRAKRCGFDGSAGADIIQATREKRSRQQGKRLKKEAISSEIQSSPVASNDPSDMS